MASHCASRQFFTVYKALSAVLDRLDSDTSEDDSTGVRGAIAVGEYHFEPRRHVNMEVNSSDSEDGNYGDWEDADAVGDRLARNFILAQNTQQSNSEEEDFGSGGAQRNDHPDSVILSEEALVMKAGCRCTSANHFQGLDVEDVRAHCLSSMELDNAELDAVILGKLAACVIAQGPTSKGKQRKRERYFYKFSGSKFCVRVFCYVHAIGKERLANLQGHFQAKGIEASVHGNTGRRPKHALTYWEVQSAEAFLNRYAERYSIPQPAAPHGRADRAPTYLPASHNRQVVYGRYRESCVGA